MRTELIISTYNNPAVLSLVLCAMLSQSHLPDCIAIADDGSGDETANIRAQYESRLPIRHVWHTDDGFRKNEILNKAIASSAADFLIFIDGDCIASPGFIARHVALAHKDRFTTGSVIRLSQRTSENLNKSDVSTGRIFDPIWLTANGELQSWSDKLKAGVLMPNKSQILDRISPVKKTWSGGNSSAFRAQLVRVNGFDETMRYGGEDKELGARLINAGVKGQFLRYTAPLLHVYHTRGYVEKSIVQANRAKILETRKTARVWTETGINRHLKT